MGITILIIDDDPYIREDLCHIVRLEGYEPTGAANGLIGLELAFEYSPDVILSDVDMPLLDGYGVLEALRAKKMLERTHFFFMTAHDVEVVYKKTGIPKNHILRKPFSMELLFKILTDHLQSAGSSIQVNSAKARNNPFNELQS